MKRGSYVIGYSIFYYIALAFALVATLFWLKMYTGQGFLDVQRDANSLENYLLHRYVIDCFSTTDPSSDAHLGAFSLSAFTDARLQQCTREPLLATLQLPGGKELQVIATNPTFKTFTSFKILHKSIVLVDGQLSLLTLGAPDETRTG